VEERHRTSPTPLLWRLFLSSVEHPKAATAGLALSVLTPPVGRTHEMRRREVFAIAAP
jgi:hypothetical protein